MNEQSTGGQVKCIVWDLDNTIWTGTLMEEDSCRLKHGIIPLLKECDRRGILLSIASANDVSLATDLLRKKGILHLFLHPQIGWNNKVSSISTIADRLGIGLDSMAFIDDEPFELEQVCQLLPSVRTYRASDYRDLLFRPEFRIEGLTDESRRRRSMYVREESKALVRERFGKTHSEFLKSCETQLLLRRADEGDLSRIMELLRRTHQLNSTGIIYSQSEVESFMNNPEYRIYIAALKDRFVDYGRIGVAICHRDAGKWELLSFLLSCRVLTRGIGSYFLSWLQCQAYRDGASVFEGHFVESERNQRMKMLYQLSGFRPSEMARDGSIRFSRRCRRTVEPPDWLEVNEVSLP